MQQPMPPTTDQNATVIAEIIRAAPDIVTQLEAFSIPWGWAIVPLLLLFFGFMRSLWFVLRLGAVLIALAILMWFGWNVYSTNYIKGDAVMTVVTGDGHEYTGYVAERPFYPEIKINRTVLSSEEQQQCPNITDVCPNEVVLVAKNNLKSIKILKFHNPAFDSVAKNSEDDSEKSTKSKQKKPKYADNNKADKNQTG